MNWRKSSRSAQANGCVEVSNTLDALRDSMNPTGPTLRVDVTALVATVKNGRFER